MELGEIESLRQQRDLLESRRLDLVKRTYDTADTARSVIRTIIGSPITQEEVESGIQWSGWVILQRSSDDVVCGMVEVAQRDTDEGEPDLNNQYAKVCLISAKLLNSTTDECGAPTLTGERIDMESADVIASEYTLASELRDVTAFTPQSNVPGHGTYDSALTNANAYLDSLDSSIQQVLQAAQA